MAFIYNADFFSLITNAFNVNIFYHLGPLRERKLSDFNLVPQYMLETQNMFSLANNGYEEGNGNTDVNKRHSTYPLGVYILAGEDGQ